MNSLATKLSLAFILVVLIGVAGVSVLIRVETARGFETYLEARGNNYLARVGDSLVDLYQATGDWRDAQEYLVGLLRSSSDRLVLADASGRVVADTSGQLLGQQNSSRDALNQTPILVGSRVVGTLYLLSFSPGPTSSQGRGPGAGQGRGPGPMAGNETGRASAPGPQQVTTSLESAYLSSVDRAILTTALVAALVAIGVGVVVSRRITRPLADLAEASQEVASGKLDRRLKVTSQDELGRVALSFNTMAANLQRNEESRRHMVADIAHDLRTPLAVIQGTVDGMLDGVIDTNQPALESIKEEVGILTKLVADLRTLSLAEAGQLKLDRSLVDLLEIAARSTNKVEPIARARGVACSVEGTSPGPIVYVDTDRMAQVLGNLLDNAIRFTPEGGRIRVSVSTGVAGKAILEVTDTGVGISAEDLPHVFDRFYRTDQSRTRKSGGSGLGLAIVKQLVEAHGGRVWAESEQGRGSKFILELPVSSVEC